MAHPPILTRRQLNRATLARQLLLERSAMSTPEAIEHLVGLQAQNPGDPYIGLWSRLRDFDPEAFSSSFEDRSVVRAALMRGTIHLVTASDHRYLAGVSASVLRRVFDSTAFAKNIAALDRDQVLAEGERLLGVEPRTRAELARALAQRWPEVDTASLGQAVTYLLPLIQVPPRGMWRRSGQARWALAATWLGESPITGPPPDEMVRRYLAAFGPATVADARTWSNLTGLREVFDRLRPGLLLFRDEQGRELFDLPDAPRPDPDTRAPARFLPEYDNVLLSHADRSRIIADVTPLGWVGNLLVDGFNAGHWKQTTSGDRLLLEVAVNGAEPESRLAGVREEAQRLAGFLASGRDHDVVLNRL